MDKGKKHLIGLLMAVVLVAGLAGLYLWQLNRQNTAAAEATPSPTPASTSIQLLNRQEEEIVRVSFTVDDQTITIEPRRGAEGEGYINTWVLADEPEILLDQSAAADVVRGLFSLSATEKLFEQVDNPAEFGISPDMATAVGHYTDGSTATVHVGKATPAKDRYYVMMEGDPALYLVYTYYGDRYFKTVGDLLDRTLPTINSDSMEYILLAERGKEPIEFGFFGSDEEMAAMYEQYGMIYVTMLSPYPGRELYYSNFEKAVLTDFMNFALGEMVALKPTDLSEYGLAEPSLELWVRDLETDVHLFFGDRVGEEQIYCKIADRPSVFLVDYNYVRLLYNINVFSFIERFIALTDIYSCNTIDIVSADGRNYAITMEHTQLEPVDGQQEGTKVVTPYVDGQLVQELAFKTFYQRLIGLSYEVEIDVFTPEDEPLHTITFAMDGEPSATVRLYAYDNNFYAVQRDDNPIQFVTSKQSVEIMFQSVLDLLAGKLDRDY